MAPEPGDMKVAIVQDWLVTAAGAERVLAAVRSLFPGDLHALVHDPKAFLGTPLEGVPVRTSFLQRVPFSRQVYRSLLPLFPAAVERIDLSEYDLILSSSYAVAKGVLVRPGQLHICYCHTPMRYAWDLRDAYLGTLPAPLRWAAGAALERVRRWDARTSGRVHHFVANSNNVAGRIRRAYGRGAEVIYPPVDVESFRPASRRGAYFVTASRLVPYKMVPLMARTFRRLGLELRIAGDGPDAARVRAECGGGVRLLGRLDDAELAALVAGARAFVFAAEEDFGIAPVEAQSCGVPVIAYGRGGALETVEDGRTGVLFGEQSEEALAAAVRRFESLEASFDPALIRRSAERFSAARFASEFGGFVHARWDAFQRAQRGA